MTSEAPPEQAVETPPRFLPWLRTGLATMIDEVAVDGLATHDSASATVAVRLVASGPGVFDVEPIDGPAIRLRGPGEVVGIDPAQVLRHDPEPGTADAEDTYFTLIEFAAPDLPWRFTPAAPADDRLQPWLALVVVEERDGVRLEGRGAGRLPALHVDDPSRELPDARQSWAWAHVHTDHDLAGGVTAALAAAPSAFRSRLLCARRLLPDRGWLACVVPTFEAGRRAGLGEAVLPDLGLAWDTEVSGEVTLPVYHSWRFRTGARGDFESLVRRLQQRELPPSVGRRDLDLSDPGGGLPGAPGVVISYQGALVSPAGRPRRWPAAHRRAFKGALRRILNAELVEATAPAPYDALRDDPVVGPPAYAAAQAGRRAVPPEGEEPVWFEELNTEPQHRTVAGVGAEVIRKDQEALMDAAWDYAAGAAAANRLLSAARLALEVATRARPGFDLLPDEDLVQLAGPAMARLAHPSGATARGAVAASALPGGLISGAFRRVSRTAGGFAVRGPAGGVALTDAVTRAALADPVGFVGAWGDVRPPPGSIAAGVPAGADRAAAQRSRRRRRVAPGSGDVTWEYVLGYPEVLDWQIDPYAGNPATGAAEPLTDLPGDVRAAMDPAGTIAAMVAARVTGLPAGGDQPVPARAAVRPSFTIPMYERLVALSVEYMVPGIGEIPDDTLGLLATNPPFVEAYVASLNHEMGREFVWREYPARLDATWFQRFWDTGPGGPVDVVPIGAWDAASGLGANAPAGAPAASLALLIKGAVLRRYPDLRVYAVEAAWKHGRRREAVPGDVRLPVFAARLQPGVAAYGFTLHEDEARGSTDPDEHPGYFFVLEQRPGAPRFGLDAQKQRFRGTAPGRWPDLSWSHLARKTGDVPTFVDVTGPSWLLDAGELRGNGGPDAWGDDAAAMARITLQRPVRLLVHADSMLPPAAPTGVPR
jgi:hypothetical protein